MQLRDLYQAEAEPRRSCASMRAVLNLAQRIVVLLCASHQAMHDLLANEPEACVVSGRDMREPTKPLEALGAKRKYCIDPQRQN